MKQKFLFTTAIFALSTFSLLAQDKKKKEIGFIVGLQRSSLENVQNINVAEEAKNNIGIAKY